MKTEKNEMIEVDIANEIIEFDFTKDEIKLDNAILEKGIAGLGRNALALFLFLCSDFSRENLVEEKDSYRLTIRNSDFFNSIGATTKAGYQRINDYIHELRTVKLAIPTWDKGSLSGRVLTGLIDKGTVYPNSNKTSVKIDKALAPYYYTVKIERDRTVARYNLVNTLKSEFSTKIYYLLVRWREVPGKKLIFEIEELKEKLGVLEKYGGINKETGKKYNGFKNFETRVLSVAKAEINEKSDIIMDYKKLAKGEAKGKGRKPITHIEFSFKLKYEKNDNPELTTEQIKDLMVICENRAGEINITSLSLFDWAYGYSKERVESKRKNAFYNYMKKTLEGDISGAQLTPELKVKQEAEKISKEEKEKRKRRTQELRDKAEREALAQIEGREQSIESEEQGQMGEKLDSREQEEYVSDILEKIRNGGYIKSPPPS